MIYLDSCALVKLIREESESLALQAWLDERADEVMVTSELARAEVLRAVRRSNHDERGELSDARRFDAELDEAAALLDDVTLVVVDRDILDRAGALEAPMVRIMDAIHLATALDLKAARIEFVTYDRRLAKLAVGAGFEVAGPS
jgi:predicted nucleic acid-binding protein